MIYFTYMKILIENIQENVVSALRRCGYHFERSVQETGEVSAARDLGPGGFPRLHCYAKIINGKDMQVNLHLDQKRPSYSGTSAHAGEYEGEIVEQEAARIRSLLSNN